MQVYVWFSWEIVVKAWESRDCEGRGHRAGLLSDGGRSTDCVFSLTNKNHFLIFIKIFLVFSLKYLTFVFMEQYTSYPAAGDCQPLLEDTANYYKLILRDILPYVKSLKNLLVGESASNYYSSEEHRIVTVSEIQEAIDRIIKESYGAKQLN